ncbi:MAG: hypothetical protein MR779_04605 [Tenericutes bacterium]|nr:hypothetical protein [Mycoplasmatota bacterium]
MNKEEYYKRIERINNRFETDRVSADEEYQLVCQRNYLSTKYIEHLEQQCKKQQEVIDKVIEYINKHDDGCYTDITCKCKVAELNITELLDILKGDKND